MATIDSPTDDLAPEFRIVRGTEDIRQRAIQKMRFFRGEWFLDTEAGVPWFQRILTRPVEIGVVNAILSSALEDVEGVVRVENVDATLDRENRAMTFSATLVTEEGSIDMEERIDA